MGARLLAMFSPLEIAVVLMFGFVVVLAAAVAVWGLLRLMRRSVRDGVRDAEDERNRKPRDDERP
jgi:hypothetical protein